MGATCGLPGQHRLGHIAYGEGGGWRVVQVVASVSTMRVILGYRDCNEDL